MRVMYSFPFMQSLFITCLCEQPRYLVRPQLLTLA
jgi:hypothetical protein